MGYIKNGTDRIYRIKFLNNTIKGELLHRGNLNFNANYPIDTLGYFENKNIQKTYWIDSKNQLRFLNKEDKNFVNWTDHKFDFIPKLELKEVIEISNDLNTGGIFHSGIIQYAFTYFNMYGQESNIFYTSPQYNIGLLDRAGSPEEIINCSFKIKLSKIETKFDYVRIYSIHRSSINDIPAVKKVVDIAIPRKDTTDTDYNPIEYLDSGVYGESIDYLHLFYLGGDPIIPKTIAQKDNTLFLGNYSLDNLPVGLLEIPRKNSSLTIPLYKLLFKANEGLTISGLDSKATSFIDLNHKDLNGDIVYNKYYSYTPDSLQNKKTTGGSIGEYESYKTFKTNETYRLGVQFQHTSGRWSEPIYINDKTIDLLNLTEPIFYGDEISFIKYKGVQASLKLHDTNWHLIQTLVSNGYIKVRGVVVYPGYLERRVVAQGVVNPTMFFCNDRANGDIHNVSSWFFRPTQNKYKIVNNQKINLELYSENDIYVNPVYGHDNSTIFTKFGTFAEWRHHRALPSARVPQEYHAQTKSLAYVGRHGGYINQEIQSLHHNHLLNCYVEGGYRTSVNGNIRDSNNFIPNVPRNFMKTYKDEPFIDQNVVTFHSPDVEFDENFSNINKETLIPKIVGYVNFTGYKSKKFFNITGGQLDTKSPGILDTYNKKLNTNTDIGYTWFSNDGIKMTLGSNLMISNPCYRDLLDSTEEGNNKRYKTFPIYPWHATGVSLGPDKESTQAKLDYNRTSNLRYSSFTTYLTSISDDSSIKPFYKSFPQNICTMGTIGNRGYNCKLSSIELYNSDLFTPIKIKFDYLLLGETFYQGNVDKVVNISKDLNGGFGYPTLATGTTEEGIDIDPFAFRPYHQQYTENEGVITLTWGLQPNRIKFNTSPHLVFGLEPEEYSTDLDSNGNTYVNQPILPCVNNQYSQNGIYGIPFWNHKKWKIRQDSIDVKYWNNVLERYVDTDHGGLWMVELWRNEDSIKNRFGDMPDRNGNYLPTQESLENLNWVPCGEPVNLLTDDNFVKNIVTVNYTEGDTYLQRYDCLKTFGKESDKQSVTEILSFVCETRIMLDGRYDKSRGQTDNTTRNNTNFNLINSVYKHSNNYFNYRTLNYNKSFSKNFPNSFVWSTAKTSGSLIDTWTNINLLSTMDVDGNLGPINGLINSNNDLIGFQDKGIFKINFNSRVQINTSDNVPITITNNYKVEGVDYLSRNVGSINKWSINNESLSGPYFIDDLSRSIYNLNKLNNLSLSAGFHNWSIINLNNNLPWTPITSNNFKLFYDNHEKDVFIANSELALCYSELSDCFTSFYSYNDVPYMFNINNKFVAISKDRSVIGSRYFLWENHVGPYNKFFNKNEGYHILYNINHLPSVEKVFDIIEFRADAFRVVNNNEILRSAPLFNTLSVWNENQSGSKTLLTPTTYLPTKDLIGKFKTWRTFIPRDNNILDTVSIRNGYAYRKNYMRGTNLFLKLESDGIVENKNVLHDIVVYMRL